MRLVVASVAMVLGMAILPPAANAPAAFAQEASASPSASVEPSPSASPSQSAEPSGSPLPDAQITLVPDSETSSFRSWAIAVTGGSASVDVLEVPDGGSEFTVTVLGQSATVELTLTLPPDQVLVARCFEIGAVEQPNRLVLEVVQGGTYECHYDTECAGPSGPPNATVGLRVAADGFDVSRPWAISVTGGRAVSFVCTPRRISTLRLASYADIPEFLYGAFSVDPFGESATVEITAPPPRGGGGLVSAQCEDESNLRIMDVLVPPRRLVLKVKPLRSYICDIRAGQGTVPPTNTLSQGAPVPSSGGWATVLAVLAGITAAGLLMVVRRPARRSARS